MYIEQLYTPCLAEAAYYIESNGEAAVIDPLRETEPYLALAAKRGATIKYVFETHFHADFVSGHIDLAKKTGATIVYGPNAVAEYNIYVGKDKELFPLGAINIELLHTPGHTLESSCFLVYSENKNPYALFTGDTVFVGDVGRPDLAVNAALSKEDLARMLYEAIQSKILPLPNHIVIYPGHGAGSACGKNIGKETHSTLGEQKQTNYALQFGSAEEFIFAVTNGLEAPPKYFFMDAAINKKGYTPIDEVMDKNCSPLSCEEVEKAIEKGAQVLDTRPSEEFINGHIPNSIHISLNGQFAVWAGSLLSFQTPLLILAPKGKEKETILRLARVGYENVTGYLEGGFNAWQQQKKKTDTTISVSAQWFAKHFEEGEEVIDVRNASEWKQGTVKGALKIPLQELEGRLKELNKNNYYYVHCKGGYRSVIACSILKKQGFTYVINIEGGFDALKERSEEILALENV